MAKPAVVRAAMLGLTNAGKSSLANALLGARVASVSRKRAATRARLTAVASRGKDKTVQRIIVDAPGVSTTSTETVRAEYAATPIADRRSAASPMTSGPAATRRRKADPGAAALNREAWDVVQSADVTLLVVDAARRPCSALFDVVHKYAALAAEEAEEAGQGQERETLLVLNKMDLLQKDRRGYLAEEIAEGIAQIIPSIRMGKTDDVVHMVSVLHGQGMAKLERALDRRAVPMEHIFETADGAAQLLQSPRDVVVDTLRCALLDRIHGEVAYTLDLEVIACAVEPDRHDRWTIDVRIGVPGGKARAGIVLGANGRTIQEVRDACRRDLAEKLHASNVDLFLAVRSI